MIDRKCGGGKVYEEKKWREDLETLVESAEGWGGQERKEKIHISEREGDFHDTGIERR